MAKGFKCGAGGGNPLNFKVIAYATEEELNAATPKGNVVGVITTDKITSWAFIATEPEAPQEGMVWISTGTSSTAQFNALKKNGIQVYPRSAKQYIGGTWTDKTAKSYRGGEWVDWFMYLYNNGDECVDITGGWRSRGWAFSESDSGDVPAVVRNGDSVKISFGVGNTCGVLETANDIDLMGKSVLKINITELKAELTSVGLRFGLVSRGATYWGNSLVAAVNPSAAGVYSIDLLNVDLNKKYDVIVGGGGSAGKTFDVTFNKIWAE